LWKAEKEQQPGRHGKAFLYIIAQRFTSTSDRASAISGATPPSRPMAILLQDSIIMNWINYKLSKEKANCTVATWLRK